MKRTYHVLYIFILSITSLLFVSCNNNETNAANYLAVKLSLEADARADKWISQIDSLAVEYDSLATQWAADLNTSDNDTINFNLHISDFGCGCYQQSSFGISWDKPIHAGLLMKTLIEADQNGLLLCDCKDGKGDGIISGIESMKIIFADSLIGFNIKLKQGTWLYQEEIASKLEEILTEHKKDLFPNENFQIY